MDRLEKGSTGMNVTYAPVVKQKDTGAFVDFFLTALIVFLTVGIIATYFITFDMTTELDVKDITVNTVWLAISTFCIGALGKKSARRKGEQTKDYAESEREATEAIKELCASEHVARAEEYAEAQTEEAIKRYRKYELTAVGIKLESFKEKYLGKGVITLFKEFTQGNISFMQFRAICRCNRLKIRAYDPNFITSYHANTETIQTASGMINVKKMDRKDDLKSVLFTICGALGVGVMLSDVVLNFSLETLFEAVIKIIMIGLNLGLKTSFGWNLSLMEIKRNKLRASEARACMEWAKRTPKSVKDSNI